LQAKKQGHIEKMGFNTGDVGLGTAYALLPWRMDAMARLERPAAETGS
jgi:hypothetical protein